MRKVALSIIDNPTGCINVSPDGQPIFCPQLRTSHFGSRYICAVFRTDQEVLDQYGVPSGTGKLQRWPECIASEIVEEGTNP